ncbi:MULTISPECIES: hypothetical protein [unclassified Pseudomonas]|uniref:hypothetical protein n=1 Tax=unclassified Pseudomonas TaxID=196821 RepID=UPI00075E1808|nr:MULTISPECIES: hypothetical protein [unclassified Pseudomonas]KVV01650.1 hypothetical protein AP060_04366 [Pseudomonas sp. TAD18]KVV03008.1 hypothetical protein AP059_04348 [Pseudomonas sp. TAA207]
MFQLTLQLYSAGQWQDAMTLVFPEPEKELDGPCRFGYKQDYLLQNLESVDSPFIASVSARVPLGWDAQHLRKAPAFLHDIAPAGAAKKILIKQIGREKPDALGLPRVTMDHPQIALKHLDHHLREWGLK